MLALTECHNNRKDHREEHKCHITAAAIGNPLVDWTALFPKGEDTMPVNRLESREPFPEPRITAQEDEDFLSIHGLLDFRQSHFRKPEHFFDPFASPSLFFRTPSFDLPYTHPPIAGYDEPINESSSFNDEAPVIIRKKRFYRRTYPPLHSTLLLPHVKVTVGEDSVLREQGLDFVERMRGSTRQEEEEKEEERPNAETPLNTTTPRFTAEHKDGLGLWGEKDVKDIADWFGDILRRP